MSCYTTACRRDKIFLFFFGGKGGKQAQADPIQVPEGRCLVLFAWASACCQQV